LRIVAVRRCREAMSLTVTESQPISQRAKRCWLTFPNMRSFCPLPYYISKEEKGKSLGKK